MSKITLPLLKKMFLGTPNAKLERFVVPFNEILPRYEITTKKRFTAFIANVGIESDRLKAMQEYASGAAYEGREGLGNVISGDGVRYKGRDLMQTTGRYNYWRVVIAYLRVLTGKDWDNKLAQTNFRAYVKSKAYSELLVEADKYNVNFLAHPELLEQFPHAVEAACVFVKDNKLNDYADKEQIFAYCGVINKGSPKKKALGYNERKALYDLANRVVPDDFSLTASKDTSTTPSLVKLTGSNTAVETKIDPNTNTEMPASLTATPTAVVEVEQVVAAADPPKDEIKPEPMVTIGNRVNAVWTAVGTTLVAVVTFLTSTPLGIAMSIIGCIALIGVIYMFFNWRRSENKEKRDQQVKIETAKVELQLKLQREQQAFELQKITLQSAMHENLNTVRLVPPPTEMPNSDNVDPEA